MPSMSFHPGSPFAGAGGVNFPGRTLVPRVQRYGWACSTPSSLGRRSWKPTVSAPSQTGFQGRAPCRRGTRRVGATVGVAGAWSGGSSEPVAGAVALAAGLGAFRSQR